METDYALVVGINNYTLPKDLGLPSLKGAVNDAEKFIAQWLLDAEGGNVPQHHIFKITSVEPPATPLAPYQKMIDDELKNLFKVVKQEIASNKPPRRLYFYFAGHGLGVDIDTSDNALCMADWSEDNRRSALSSKEYRELFIRLGYFKELIFLSDCCRNTKINIRPQASTIDPIIAAATAANTRFFIGYATQFQDQSREVEEEGTGEKRGVFTKVLLEGLSGNAINEEGNAVDADSLRDYLARIVPLEAQKSGFKQKPDIYHNFSSADPLIFRKYDSNAKVECHFQFAPERTCTIQLVNEMIDVVAKFDVHNGEHAFIEHLTPGVYVLIDTATGNKKKVVLTPNKSIEHVDF